jgi:hypothetical protein
MEINGVDRGVSEHEGGENGCPLTLRPLEKTLEKKVSDCHLDFDFFILLLLIWEY